MTVKEMINSIGYPKADDHGRISQLMIMGIDHESMVKIVNERVVGEGVNSEVRIDKFLVWLRFWRKCKRERSYKYDPEVGLVYQFLTDIGSIGCEYLYADAIRFGTMLTYARLLESLLQHTTEAGFAYEAVDRIAGPEGWLKVYLLLRDQDWNPFRI